MWEDIPEDEICLQVGDVLLVVTDDLYSIPRGTTGIITKREMFNHKPIIHVKYDNNSFRQFFLNYYISEYTVGARHKVRIKSPLKKLWSAIKKRNGRIF